MRWNCQAQNDVRALTVQKMLDQCHWCCWCFVYVLKCSLDWHCILDAVSFIVVEYALLLSVNAGQACQSVQNSVRLNPSHASSWTASMLGKVSFVGISVTDSITHMNRSSESIRRSTFNIVFRRDCFYYRADYLNYYLYYYYFFKLIN